MKKYSSYKPSDINWIGEIPSVWNIIPFKRLTQIKRGASPRPIDDQKYFDENGEFGWVRIADVTASDRYLENTTQKLSELGASLSVKRYPGDLFLSIAGTVGKPIISKIKCCIHDGFVWFPDLKINPEFLYYIFSAGLAYQGLGKLGTQLNLNTETVGYINLPLPPEEEICQIVRYLDKKIVNIDNLISKKQKLIALLKEERTAMISEAVTKGTSLKAKHKKSKLVWLSIPDHWKEIRAKKVFYESDELAKGDEELLSVSHYTGVTPRSEKKVYMFLAESYEGYKLCKKDDLVINTMWAWMGALGISEYEGIVSAGYGVYRLKDKTTFIPGYLNYLLRTPGYVGEYIKRSKGIHSSRWRLYPDEFFQITIICPPIEEQREIIDYIRRETQKIDQAMARFEKEIDLLQEYRTALISEVVTGKIDVREEVASWI